MSVQSYRSTVERLNKELAQFDTQIARERDYALRAQSDAVRIMSSVTSSTSSQTRMSKQRELQRKNEEANRYSKKVADLETRRANKLAELNRNLKSLESAIQTESRNSERDQKRRRDEEARHTRSITQELEKQMRVQRELQHSRFAIDLTRLPEKIKILFIGSNPLDQHQLRLDEEVREIDRMMRQADYRDNIELVTWWAARPKDLIQAINEHRPTIIHFSGHGDDAGNLVFQDDAGGTRLVSADAVSATIATVAETVELVVFNACFSELQATLVTNHIPAAIGMNDAVGDRAARVFAAQFYSSIGFGKSLATAFDQGKAALLLEAIPEGTTPQLVTAPELDPANIVFVKPPR